MKGNCESLMSHLNSAWYIVSTQKKKKKKPKRNSNFPPLNKSSKNGIYLPRKFGSRLQHKWHGEGVAICVSAG